MCSGTSDDDLIEDIFGQDLRKKHYDNMDNKIILAPRNVDVNNMNNKITEK